MSVRLTGALVAALALLTALPAGAAAQLSRDAQKVYDDYRSDAAIQPCDHDAATYRRTLREITPDIEEETPAFRPAVEAALRERRRDRDKRDCAAPGPDTQDAGRRRLERRRRLAGRLRPARAARAARARARSPAPAPPAANPAPAPAPSEQAPAPEATPAPTVAPAPPVASSAPAPPAAPVLLNRPHEGTPSGSGSRSACSR